MLLLALDPFDKIVHQDVHLFLPLSLSPLSEIIVAQVGTSASVEKCEEDGQAQQAEGLHFTLTETHRWPRGLLNFPQPVKDLSGKVQSCTYLNEFCLIDI